MMSFQPKQLPRAPTATGSVRAGNAIRRPYRCAADLPPPSPPTSGIPAGPHRLKAAPDIGAWLGGGNAGDLSAYLARFTTTALSGATTVRARPIDLRARVWSSHRSRRHRVDTYSVPPARAGGGGGPTGAPMQDQHGGGDHHASGDAVVRGSRSEKLIPFVQSPRCRDGPCGSEPDYRRRPQWRRSPKAATVRTSAPISPDTLRGRVVCRAKPGLAARCPPPARNQLMLCRSTMIGRAYVLWRRDLCRRPARWRSVGPNSTWTSSSQSENAARMRRLRRWLICRYRSRCGSTWASSSAQSSQGERVDGGLGCPAGLPPGGEVAELGQALRLGLEAALGRGPVDPVALSVHAQQVVRGCPARADEQQDDVGERAQVAD